MWGERPTERRTCRCRRSGWEGGYGTAWFTDTDRDLIGICLTQTSDFLFNGGRDEFIALAANV